MNKILWLHIRLLCIGLLFYSEVSAIPPINVQTTTIKTDSLNIDNSSIKTRSFDNLKERYSGDDFTYELTVENSGWWTRFKHWLSEWIRDLFRFKNPEKAAKITDITLKTIGVIIVLLMIYFIFKAVMNDEGSWVFGKSSDKINIPVTDIASDIHKANFKTLIANAENENNYRLAIRYYYLWLLKALSNAEIIKYDVEKTNSDYLNEINSKELKTKFGYVSYLYNYIWYGEFDVDQSQFNKAKDAFNNLLKDLKA